MYLLVHDIWVSSVTSGLPRDHVASESHSAANRSRRVFPNSFPQVVLCRTAHMHGIAYGKPTGSRYFRTFTAPQIAPRLANRSWCYAAVSSRGYMQG